MKDKVKGLVLGALLGSAITGTAAYASGVQIEVFFRPLTYIFDGVEKSPSEGQGFIYEGSTYVPLRFVSEALGKEVGWDEATGTIMVDEPGAREVIAMYQDGETTYKITQAMLDKQIAINLFYSPGNSQYADDVNYRNHMISESVSYLLAEARVSPEILEQAAAKSPEQLAGLKVTFDKYYDGQESWESYLYKLKLTENDILEYLRRSLVRDAYLASLVSEEELQADYEAASANHEFDKATVRHILVSFQSGDGKTRSKEEALARAREVLSKLRSGSDFGQMALSYSDDPGSSGNGGRYENAEISNWVEEFKQAVIQQPVGQIGEPVETMYGYHIIQVESRTSPALEDVRDTLLATLKQTEYRKFVQESIPAMAVPVQ